MELNPTLRRALSALVLPLLLLTMAAPLAGCGGGGEETASPTPTPQAMSAATRRELGDQRPTRAQAEAVPPSHENMRWAPHRELPCQGPQCPTGLLVQHGERVFAVMLDGAPRSRVLARTLRGEVWSEAQELSVGMAHPYHLAGISLPERAAVTWTEWRSAQSSSGHREGEGLLISTFDGNRWSTPRAIVGGNQGVRGPRLVATPDNRLLSVAIGTPPKDRREDPAQLLLSLEAADGSFSPLTGPAIPGGVSPYQVTLQFDRQSGVHLFLHATAAAANARGSNVRTFYIPGRWDGASISWQSPQPIEEVGLGGGARAMATDGEGVLHAAWYDKVEQDFGVWGNRLVDGTWTEPERLDAGEMPATSPSFLSADSGLQVLFAESNGAELVLARKRWLNGAWERLRDEQGLLPGGQFPVAVEAADASLYLLWTQMPIGPTRIRFRHLPSALP